MRIIYYGYPLWDYFLSSAGGSHELIKSEPLSFRSKLALHAFWNRGFRSRFLDFADVANSALSDEPTIVMDIYSPAQLWRIAKKCGKDAPRYLWFWNPLKPTLRFHDIHRTVALVKDMGYRIFTFDPDDAEEFGIEYKNQFGARPAERNVAPRTDLYFCGNAKGRIAVIERVGRLCRKYGLSENFVIPRKQGIMINYSRNLENVRNSKCVLDIVQRGQSGLTLRPIEALLNSKKLITDNAAVERYDFYDPRNIFILGKDDESRIKEFVDSPFVEVPESVIEKYEFGNWLNSWR